MQRTPVTGISYLGDSSVSAAIRGLAPPGQGADLIADFRSANARGTNFGDLWSIGPTYFDSATARQLLSESDSALAGMPFVHDYLAGRPVSAVPAMLALSAPGVSDDGDYALLYAELHDRAAHTPDLLEAAGFLILRRDGARWLIVREVPIPRPRAQ